MMKIELDDTDFGMSMDTSESTPVTMNEDSSPSAAFQMQPPQPQQQHQLQQPQHQMQMPQVLPKTNEDEIFRSMKINDTSKTPYSDATQVSRCGTPSEPKKKKREPDESNFCLSLSTSEPSPVPMHPDSPSSSPFQLQQQQHQLQQQQHQLQQMQPWQQTNKKEIFPNMKINNISSKHILHISKVRMSLD